MGKLPHIGWTEVSRARESPLWRDLPQRIYLYHVHSYVPHPTDPQTVIATAEYGERFPAVVGAGNVYGAQSHPEKSSTHGLRPARQLRLDLRQERKLHGVSRLRALSK